MQILILGAGQVGSSVAASLAREDDDITVVDENNDLLQELQDHYDIRTVQGHASHPDVLARAGAEDADLILAVTNSDGDELYVEIDENTHQFTIIREEDLLETFEITQIELLETGWGEFPYVSSFVDEKDWGKYIDIIKDAFDEISENNQIMREFRLRQAGAGSLY